MSEELKPCQHPSSWFDRTITIREDGKERMASICCDCGREIDVPENNRPHFHGDGIWMDCVPCLTEEISSLRAKLKEAEAESLEQARLLGMGAEREADLLAKVEDLGKKLKEAEAVLHQIATWECFCTDGGEPSNCRCRDIIIDMVKEAKAKRGQEK